MDESSWRRGLGRKSFGCLGLGLPVAIALYVIFRMVKETAKK